MLIYNNGSSSVSDNLQEALERIKAARETQTQNLKENQQQSSISSGTALSVDNSEQNYYNNVDTSSSSSSSKTNTTDNVLVRSVGTLKEGLDNIQRGVLGSFEGIIDTLIYGAGQVGSWFGADTKWAEDAIKFDITDKIIKYNPSSGIENIIYKISKGDMGANISDESYLQEANAKTQEIVQGVEQGIGSSLAALAGMQLGTAIAGVDAVGEATLGAKAIGTAMFGAGAGGQSINEALQEGASYNQAGLYGLASGVTEAAVEHLSDLFGVGTFAGQLSSKTLSKLAGKSVGKVAGELTKTFVAEGLEEVASDILNPLYQSFYNGKSVEENYANFAEDVKEGSLLTTFVVGGLSGVLMDGTSMATQAIYYSKDGMAIRDRINEVKDKAKAVYATYQNAPQTTLEEQNTAKTTYDTSMQEIRAEMAQIGEDIKQLKDKYQVRLKAEELNAKYVTSLSSNSLQQEDIYNIVENDLGKVLNEKYNVEFVDDNNEYNGKINKDTNTIYLSNNPQVAYRQVITHEITHALEKVEGYSGVANEIVEYLKANEEESYNKKVDDLKKQGYNNNEINNEIVANYVAQKLTKSYNDVHSLFKTQTAKDKFINMLKNLRKNTPTESKLRSKLQKMIQNAYKINVAASKENANMANNKQVATQYDKKDTNKEIKENGGYTDDFRRIQEESRRMSVEELQSYRNGSKSLTKEQRARIEVAFKEVLHSIRSSKSFNESTLVNPKTQKQVTFIENVDGKIFHDIFEISRYYLKYSELVDLHEKYDNAKCFISDNGLSGFAIENDGNLISVYNLELGGGFLDTTADYIIKNGATHLDCYVSFNQPLMLMYERKLGFKTASIMDYNMEYDHDDIAKNHDNPKVAFMVNTNVEVETKHFDKTQYDEAQAYQLSFLNNKTTTNEQYQRKSQDVKNDADLHNEKVYNIVDSDSLFDTLDDLFSRVDIQSKVTFKGARAQAKFQAFEMLNQMGNTYNQVAANNFTSILLQNIRIDNMNIYDYVASKTNLVRGEIDEVATWDYLHSRITEELQNIYIKEGHPSYKSIVETTRNALITEIKSMIHSIKSAGKIGYKIAQEKQKLKDFVNKKYVDGTPEALFNITAKKLNQMNVFDTQSIKGNFRDQMLDLKQTFFENENIQAVREDKGAAINNTIDSYLNYFIDQAEIYKDRLKKPSLNFTNKIDEFGKTEAEMALSIMKYARNLINTASDNATATINGLTYNVRDTARKEATLQVNTKRRGTNSKVIQLFTSLADRAFYFRSLLSNADSNSIFNNMYSGLVQAQDEAYRVQYDLEKELRSYFDEKDGKKIRKTLKTEIEFKGQKITIDEAIAIILSSENPRAFSHITGLGIELTRGNKQDVIYNPSTFFDGLTDEEIATIQDTTDKSQEAIAERQRLRRIGLDNTIANLKAQISQNANYDKLMDIYRNLYSNAGTYYIDASDRMNGFHYELNQNYYPLKVGNYEFSKELGNENYVNDVFNPSFSKKANENARQAIRISGALGTAINFTKQLGIYYGVTPEIKAINKILNKKVNVEGMIKPMPLMQYMEYKVDKQFRNRLDGLFRAMQGMKTGNRDGSSRVFNFLRSMNAKYNLGANAKVMVSQFLSYPMAFSYLSFNSMTKGLGGPSIDKRLKGFDYLSENSSYIQNRYIDNNVLNAEAVGALNTSLNATQKASDFLMAGISGVDKFTLTKLWYACQYETNFDYNKALILFEQVARDTQPQYDPLGNGSITLVGSEIVKSQLMYSSVTRKYYSRLLESVYRVFKADKSNISAERKTLAKTTSGFMVGTVLMTLLSVMVKNLKGDYDDDEKEDIIKSMLLDDFAGQIVGLIPFAKSLYNKFVNGYDLEMIGFNEINNFLDMIQTDIPNAISTSATNQERRKSIWKICQSIASLMGIPVKNLYNDMLMACGLVDTVSGGSVQSRLKLKNAFGYATPTALNNLITMYAKKGKDEQLAEAIKIKVSQGTGDNVSQVVADELSSLYKKGALSRLPSSLANSISINGEEYTINKNERSQMESIYKIANDEVEDLIRSNIYKALNDNAKAKAIMKLYEAYYTDSKSQVLGATASKLSFLTEYTDIGDICSIVAHCSDTNDDGKAKYTKQQKVAYINSQRITSGKKYLALYLCGYTLSESNTSVAKNYLIRLGVSKKVAEEFFS